MEYQRDTNGLNYFATESTLHLFRHSLGYCDEETAHPIRHAIDRHITEEKCLNCGEKLIKITHVNRIQCVQCYSAQCFHCKKSVDPDIYQSFQHFRVEQFNYFRTGLTAPQLISHLLIIGG